MLKLTVSSDEAYDEKTQQFISNEVAELHLEHSLVSVSKWESIFEKPFISKEDKHPEEMIEYIRVMTLNEVPDSVYDQLQNKDLTIIGEYIAGNKTATWFNDRQMPRTRSTGEQVTSELIYYWLVALNIPFDCETWHLNRLLTLVRITNLKNQPSKKMPRKEAMAQQRALNDARRAQMNSTG